MSRIAITYLLLLAIFQEGHAVKCYLCVNCKTVDMYTNITVCTGPSPIYNPRMNNACVTFKDKYGNVVRGCGWSTGKFCEERYQSIGTGEYCYCQSELCNESIKIECNIVVALIALCLGMLLVILN
ncbi:uncharacterized protein LOC144425180 [Styela clava]